MKFDIFMTVKLHIFIYRFGFVSVVSSTLKMEAVCSSTSTLFYYHSAWCHIQIFSCIQIQLIYNRLCDLVTKMDMSRVCGILNYEDQLKMETMWLLIRSSVTVGL